MYGNEIRVKLFSGEEKIEYSYENTSQEEKVGLAEKMVRETRSQLSK